MHLPPLRKPGRLCGCPACLFRGVQLQGVPPLWWPVMTHFPLPALKSFGSHAWVRVLLHSPSLWIPKARNYPLATLNPTPAVRWRAHISDSAAVGDFLGSHPTQMTWRKDENKLWMREAGMCRQGEDPRGLAYYTGNIRPWDNDSSKVKNDLAFCGPQVRLIKFNRHNKMIPNLGCTE